MPLETLSSTDFPTCLVYETISAAPLLRNDLSSLPAFGGNASSPAGNPGGIATDARPVRKKRRRRQRSCKNEEEAESQRMTHIAVERNRRRLMNEHLAVLRSLMPQSYLQKGDQASIVGGAIDFVKELEQLLQSLEMQKRKQAVMGVDNGDVDECSHRQAPFAGFFAYPQYIWCHAPRDCPPLPAENRSAVADVEVTLTETHASVRVLTRRRARQLLGMMAGLQSLRLSILHLNVTTSDRMVLYSFSIKVEEGCNLTTVDDIAAAVHHMLTLIEADSTGLTQ